MYRIGHGYDAHRFEKGRPLIIGGVEILYDYGLAGHSDADVLTHAVIDALLGAAALGDIGGHFPDSDEAYRNIDSMRLLAKVADMLTEKGYTVGNIDGTVIAQRPKLAGYIQAMRTRLAQVLNIEMDQINIKATTEEKMGFTGKEEGIAAHCVCLLEKRR